MFVGLVIAEVADRAAIMHNGVIVDTGPTADVFHSPTDDYTRALLAAHPRPTPPTSRADARG